MKHELLHASMRAILDRQLSDLKEPYEVAPDVWDVLRRELQDVVDIPLLTDAGCNRRNFLLCGVPVVAAVD